MRLHKQNFCRLAEQQGLVEETGGSVATGGLPARLARFRCEVLLRARARSAAPQAYGVAYYLDPRLAVIDNG